MADHPLKFADRFLRAWQLYERAVGAGRLQAKDFAAALGVPASNITAWQVATEAPPHHRVLRIAEVTGTDPGWLAYGADSQAPVRKAWPTRADRAASPRRTPDSKMRSTPVDAAVARQKAVQKRGKEKGA